MGEAFSAVAGMGGGADRRRLRLRERAVDSLLRARHGI